MSTTVGATSEVRPRHRTRRAISIPEGVIEVIRSGYPGSEEEVETLQVPKFEGPVAYVRVEGSVTRNMGDYNSVRVAVMVEMPCYPTASDVDRAHGWCSSQVDQKIQHELRVAVGDAGAQNGG